LTQALDRFSVAMLQILERLPKAKGFCSAKWPEDDDDGVKLTIASEVTE